MDLSEKNKLLFKNYTKDASQLGCQYHEIYSMYSGICSSPRILKMLLYDLEMLLGADYDSQTIYRIVTNTANRISEKSGFIRTDKSFLGALITFWISYCMEYKNYGRVYNLLPKTRGLCMNEEVAQCAIGSEFLNTLHGPESKKQKVISTYFDETFGTDRRVHLDKHGDKEFWVLLWLLEYTGFHYIEPVAHLIVTNKY